MNHPQQLSTANERWRFLARAEDAAIPVFWAGMVVAQDEYSGLDINAFEAELQSMVRQIEAVLPTHASALTRVRALNDVLFHELGFRGNDSNYYDPRNSYLNEVMQRRLGIPISLAVLQLELARRIDVPLEGVAFPGHFLVRLPVDDGLLVLDPYERGRSLDVDELKQRATPHVSDRDVADNDLNQLLMPASTRAILLRMLRNLKQIYAETEDWARALRTTDRILTLDPMQHLELRDRGVFYLRVGHAQAGVKDLAAYLAKQPKASDAEQIRQLMVESGVETKRIN